MIVAIQWTMILIMVGCFVYAGLVLWKEGRGAREAGKLEREQDRIANGR